jgi:hypothetical protein
MFLSWESKSSPFPERQLYSKLVAFFGAVDTLIQNITLSSAYGE